MVAERYGAASYWLSDDSWTWLKTQSTLEGVSIRGFIEKHYREWTSGNLCVRDTALRELWDTRIAQGDGGPRDRVVYRAVYVEFGGRWQHTLDLSIDCVAALAVAADRWGLPRHFVTRNPVGLAALTLEMIGREWVCDG